MEVVVGAAAVFAALLLCLFAILLRSLFARGKTKELDPDWLESYSISTYRPLNRLLNEADIEFLRSQPGYEPEMERKLRGARRRVFRMYLKNMARDFDRLHFALRLMILHAPQDKPELARTLIRQKIRFKIGLIETRLRLELYVLGVGGVDVRGLVSALETMRTEVQAIMANPAPSKVGAS